MDSTIAEYNEAMEPADKDICEVLAATIDRGLSDSKNTIWHAHPVLFLDGNPIVGYSKQKRGFRLMFWSGAEFEEPGLYIVGKKFKDASVFYNDVTEINTADLKRWLNKSKVIQWDWGGTLERLPNDCAGSRGRSRGLCLRSAFIRPHTVEQNALISGSGYSHVRPSRTVSVNPHRP